MFQSWLDATIALLHKSGPRAQPQNYRPVALLHYGEKLVSLIILKRVRKSAYGYVNKKQKGSIQGLSCRHAVFQLLRDMETAIRDGDTRAYDFTDFQKAYDSLDWERLSLVIQWQGFPPDLAELVRKMYNRATFCLKLGPGQRSSATQQKSGIRQGSSLSPLIFILVLNFALCALEETMVEDGYWTKSKVDPAYLSWLGFVDDLVIRSDTREEAQHTLHQLQAACRFVGLELNAKKTEAMTVGLPPREKNNEDAKKERITTDEADGERWGWSIERKLATTPAMEKITHLIAWDDGRHSLCWYKRTGWAELDGRRTTRLIRRGRVRSTVPSFKYLGTEIASNASTTKEVERRTGIATATTKQLRRIWADKGVPRGLKSELYTSLCSSVALYNSECWVPHEHDLKILRSFQHQTLKAITGEQREWQRQEAGTDEAAEYASRLEICKKAGILDIETMLQEKRVAWVAHAFRDTTEPSGRWIAKEIRARTPWGKLVEQD
ncbi:unnamed protein product, partial [Amoebophrya sp. A120]|eukprot:GSA120T00008369001.1